MPHDLQCEAIAKFLIPDRPQEDNYLDPNEFKEKEKEWMEQQDQALACCTVWVEKEQLAENRCIQEAAVGGIIVWYPARLYSQVLMPAAIQQFSTSIQRFFFD